MSDEVRDHWHWRPGWREGRSFYTWHLTFAEHPEAADLVAAYQPVLAAMPGLAPVPLEWIHLTLQGLGFTDRVDQRDLDAIIEAAEFRLAGFGPIPVTIGPAQLDTETVQLPVRPVEPLQRLRDAVRTSIADIWGPDAIPELPELHPHISLGYFTADAPAAPLRSRLAAAPHHSTALTISSVSLIDLNRDHRMYQWAPVTTLRLDPLRKPV
jgi:2'-5' RNA ligase